MSNELEKCVHCSGTGTCNIADKSCDSCLKAKGLNKGLAVCDICLGFGKTSAWQLQTRESTNKPIENTLTGYSALQEQKTIRTLDKRRFTTAIIAFIIGVILIFLGIFTNNLNVLLPVASSLMTGVIGYYVGGQINQRSKSEKET